jgi:hypothetical protein
MLVYCFTLEPTVGLAPPFHILSRKGAINSRDKHFLFQITQASVLKAFKNNFTMPSMNSNVNNYLKCHMIKSSRTSYLNNDFESALDRFWRNEELLFTCNEVLSGTGVTSINNHNSSPSPSIP